VERIGDDVRRALDRTGGDAGPALTRITDAWPAVVGETVVRHAWPLRVARDGTLHIATSSSTWAFELDRLGPEIGERLTAQLGDEAPSKLRFAPGPLPEPDRPSGPAPEPLVPDPDVAAAADGAASEIEDPELRELVARAARASLQKARADRRF
jgi:hypothetical protein